MKWDTEPENLNRQRNDSRSHLHTKILILQYVDVLARDSLHIDLTGFFGLNRLTFGFEWDSYVRFLFALKFICGNSERK